MCNYLNLPLIVFVISFWIANLCINVIAKRPIFNLIFPISMLPFSHFILLFVINILKSFIVSILKIFKPMIKIKICSLKDAIPYKNRWGVYFITCSCILGYIGQTKRPLKYRLTEHQWCESHQEINVRLPLAFGFPITVSISPLLDFPPRLYHSYALTYLIIKN